MTYDILYFLMLLSAREYHRGVAGLKGMFTS